MISRCALVLLPLLLLPACRGREGGGPAAGTVAAPPSAPARRIIALTPSLVETLFALGLGDRVVAVGDYTRWPEEAVRKPHVGGLFNPNLERIVSLRPDLAVLLPSEKDLGAKLEPLGIDLLIVPDESLADVERSFHTIAERCGVREAGDRFAAEWRAGLSLPPLPGPPLKVMISVGRPTGRLGEIVVAGHGTYLDELLGRLGAVNVFADSPTLYPQISVEEIVARKPDVILELRADPQTPQQIAALVQDWRPLSEVPAVRNGAVEVLAGTHVLIPGPRLPQFYRDMREALVKARETASRQASLPSGASCPPKPHPRSLSTSWRGRAQRAKSSRFGKIAAATFPLSTPWRGGQGVRPRRAGRTGHPKWMGRDV
ncbi:MAG: ABC transporter substrate-binding protein [Thermoanaerobaculia bacterium]